MHWMYGNYGPGFSPGIGPVMILFWILVLFVGVILFKTLLGGSRKGGTEAGDRSAEDIARDRYARGEIGEEEFHRMKENLRR